MLLSWCKNLGVLGFLGFALIALLSCQYTVDKSEQNANPSGLQGKLDQQLNFAIVSEQVLKPKCLNCHSNAQKNSGGVNLESFASVRSVLADIKNDIQSGDMPRAPIPPLTDEEKFLVLAWIQIGAPKDSPPVNSIPESSPIPQPDPQATPTPQPVPTPIERDLPTQGLEPKFSSIYNLIFKTKCLECHQAGGDAELIPFEKYSDIVFGKMVIPNDPEHSILPKHLKPDAKKVMPPIKSKYKILAQEDFDIIIEWIRQGALDN
jgi:uncharacterized membrane protein